MSGESETRRLIKVYDQVYDQYPTIFIEQVWSINDLIYYMKRESFGAQRGILSGRDIAIRPALVANHREVFGSSRPFIELAISYALYNGLLTTKMELFFGRTQLNSSVMHVDSQLVCLPTVRIFKPVRFACNICFFHFEMHV